jgi:hypothetical protein
VEANGNGGGNHGNNRRGDDGGGGGLRLRQEQVQIASSVATAPADSSGAVESGIACSGQKWQWSSLLEEEVA